MIKLINADRLPEDGINLPDKLMPFIWYFIRQCWPAFLLIAVIRATADTFHAMIPYFIKLIVDAFTTIEDRSQIWDALAGPAFWFVLLVLIGVPVFARLGDWMMANVRPAFTNMMRRQLALYMHRHSYEYFQSDFAGRLASKVVETPDAISLIVQLLLGSVGIATVTMVVTLVLFAGAHWMLIGTLATWFCIYLGILCYFIPRVMDTSRQASDDRSLVRGRYVDTLSNILTVKLFARWKHEDEYLREALDQTTDSGRKMMHTVNNMNIAMEFNETFFLGAVFCITIFLWQDGAISTGDVAMVLPMMMRIANISWWMSDVFSTLFAQLGQVKEGMETIIQSHNVTDDETAANIKITKGHIKFDHVDFAYDTNKVFDRLQIDIPSGQKVGLIGPSGAGKSTLVQLLLRLYDVDGGAVTIDGQNIAKGTQDSLRSQIAVIPQMTDLLHRSIFDNIRYGRLDATDEEVRDAARKAHIDEFVKGLVDNRGNRGYDAFVGERGVKLSGGQRQRIAIARAILKNAPVLVLDEATSALDSESEKYIQESLKDLMEGKTVIAIAHRLSTIAHLDRLIVMDDGKIVEDGTHKKLLKAKGLYAKLWAMQSGGFLISGDDEQGEEEGA